ncbi:MAG: DUF4388 domain-containing protein [Actinomycetota bacterium]
MSALVGDLSAFALPDVFRLLSQNKQSGALKVVRESGDGFIYLRGGQVYFAQCSLTKEFLGQRLAQSRLITQGQLLRVLDEQKKRGDVRIGDLLVEKGFVSKEMLDTFVQEEIQDAIFHLLQWDVGVFTFDEGVVSEQEVGLSVSVETLIMESSRRLDEWEVIQRKIPSLDVVVRMAQSPPEDVVEINIKPEEWSLLVLADGIRSVRDIAAATERSEFDACKILYGLITAGLLEVPGRPIELSNEEPSRLSSRDVDDTGNDDTGNIAPPVLEPDTLEISEIHEIRLDSSEKGDTGPAATAVEVSVVSVPSVVSAPNGDKKSEGGKTKEGTLSVQTVPAVSTQTQPVSKETLLRLIAGVRSL